MDKAKDAIEDAGERIQESFEDTAEAKEAELDTIRKYFASLDSDDFDEWLTVMDPEDELDLSDDDFKSFLKMFGDHEQNEEDD